MDPNLMNLKQRMIKTSIEFIRAQRVYLKVTAPNSRASQTEPSVPISLETLSSDSLMSRAKEIFNVSRLIIIKARESITR
jgi:hypothetical protein